LSKAKHQNHNMNFLKKTINQRTTFRILRTKKILTLIKS